ncbi:LysR family transcriptional regulator [Sutcliffiella cohnii]
MEFAWLKTFVTAAEYENFKRTADVLFISQPTVTVHVKLLEKELGIKLFQREGRRVKLTEEGVRYLEHAKKLLHVYEEGLKDINSFSQGYTKKLSIAISPLIADTILPFVLKSYTKRYPEVEIDVKIAESVDIEEIVLNEEVDLGLSCLKSTNTNLHSEMLYKDEVVFVAPHDGRDFETAPPLDEEELLENNYLLTHNHPAYWDTLSLLIKNKIPSVKMMKVSQIHITKRFISEGLGVSFLPRSTVRRELLEGRLLEVYSHSFSLPDANTYAIMKYHHEKQKEFLTFLKRYYI